MSRELSQNVLEQMVNGDPQIPNVIFYEQAILDHEASNNSGERVYHKAVFVKITQPGVTDWVSYKAKRADFAAYPEEYDAFMNNKQGTRDPGVEIIPNLDITHLQELIDRGFSTIPKLAEALQVPEHLEYALQSAIAINNVLKEARNAKQEENIQEESTPTPDVSAPDRQDHPTGLQRSEVPSSLGSKKDGSASGVYKGGRIDNRKDIDNWRADFVFARS